MIQRPSQPCPQCGRPLPAGMTCVCADADLRDLLARLELAPDQTDRRQHFERIRAEGSRVLPYLLAVLEEPSRHPWYYLRNVLAMLGEIGPLDVEAEALAVERIQSFLSLRERRQIVIAAIHSLARLGGPQAETLLIRLLQQKPGRTAGTHDSEGERLSPLDYATKLVEGLCIVRTESALRAVMSIGLGKRVTVTRRHDSLRQAALELLAGVDLGAFPSLRKEIQKKITSQLIHPRFSLRRAITGRNLRLDSALVASLRRTSGSEILELYRQLLGPDLPPAIQEIARQILAERESASDGTPPPDSKPIPGR
jgi:hypothetical protein